jgi:hypothetical protein
MNVLSSRGGSWDDRQLGCAKGARSGKANLSLKKVALSCGFFDGGHLSKSFRRLVGLSPGARQRSRFVVAPNTWKVRPLPKAIQSGKILPSKDHFVQRSHLYCSGSATDRGIATFGKRASLPLAIRGVASHTSFPNGSKLQRAITTMNEAHPCRVSFQGERSSTDRCPGL